jgi:hypothetical protein
MKGDPKVIEMLQQAQARGISSISLGKLLSGFKGGPRALMVEGLDLSGQCGVSSSDKFNDFIFQLIFDHFSHSISPPSLSGF